MLPLGSIFISLCFYIIYGIIWIMCGNIIFIKLNNQNICYNIMVNNLENLRELIIEEIAKYNFLN